MRVAVNLARCQGYGQCVFLAPDVFTMPDGEVLMYEPHPGEEKRERVLRAAAACPVQAVVVDQVNTLDARTTAARRPRRGKTLEGTRRIVIVGASLAGLRAATTLREEGYRGSLTLVGDEPEEPYDRPPLSKQVLTGRTLSERTLLPRRRELDAEWLLGRRATGLDVMGKQIVLDDDRTIDFDRLLIATGVRSRPWPNAAEAALDGVFVLRTTGDAARLRQRLAAGPGRVLIIGAGFTGSEVASACRDLKLLVTVVERGPAPLVAALGEGIGGVAADMQRAHGVDLRCGVMVTSLEGDSKGRLCRAHLSDGDAIDVDVAVAALGTERNIEWLEDSGLAAGVWGVACDAGCRAFDVNGLVTDDIFVAGDIARFPHPVCEYQFLSLEHWSNALSQAQVAAHNMICAGADRWPHLSLPVFWSAQFGTNIKSVGMPTFADEVAITQGSVADRRFVAAYGYRGRVIGAVTFDQARWLEFYQGLIERARAVPARRRYDRPARRDAGRRGTVPRPGARCRAPHRRGDRPPAGRTTRDAGTAVTRLPARSDRSIPPS